MNSCVIVWDTARRITKMPNTTRLPFDSHHPVAAGAAAGGAPVPGGGAPPITPGGGPAITPGGAVRAEAARLV